MTERRHSGGVTACTLMQLHDCFYTSSGTSRAGCCRHPKAHPWTSTDQGKGHAIMSTSYRSATRFPQVLPGQGLHRRGGIDRRAW
jgi:hypothetical protein